MTKYAPALRNLTMENITMYSLPGEYSGSEYAASYWLPNMNEIRVLVETVFGYDTTYVTDGKAIEGAEYGNPSTGDISLTLQDTRHADTAIDTMPEDNITQNTIVEDDIKDRPAVRNKNTTAKNTDTGINTDNSAQQEQSNIQNIPDNSQSESDNNAQYGETDNDTPPPAETDTPQPVVNDDNNSQQDNGGFVRPGVNTD